MENTCNWLRNIPHSHGKYEQYECRGAKATAGPSQAQTWQMVNQSKRRSSLSEDTCAPKHTCFESCESVWSLLLLSSLRKREVCHSSQMVMSCSTTVSSPKQMAYFCWFMPMVKVGNAPLQLTLLPPCRVDLSAVLQKNTVEFSCLRWPVGHHCGKSILGLLIFFYTKHDIKVCCLKSPIGDGRGDQRQKITIAEKIIF